MAYFNKKNNSLYFYIYTCSERIEFFVRFQTERHVRNRSVFFRNLKEQKKVVWGHIFSKTIGDWRLMMGATNLIPMPICLY